jgi:putative ABC transport system substrate-binding protein
MSYGIEMLETYRQAASYIDRILKGEKPSDLPIQRRNEFVINLKMAKALRLDVPPSVIAAADEVIDETSPPKFSDVH